MKSIRQRRLLILLLALAVVLTGYLIKEGTPLFLDGQGQAESNEAGRTGENWENPVVALERATVNVVEEAGPAVVKIRTIEEQVIQDFLFRTIRQRPGVGSGVIFARDGYILTNNHVVENATEISVSLPGRNESYEAEIVGTDPFTDLAVLKINARNLPVAPFGDSDELRVGQYVIAIGNPFGFENSVTSGLVSALGRGLIVDPQTRLQVENVIQTDASINPGNSGGPLLNLRGEVVGINTAIIQQAQGIGFAIPINTARAVVDDILNYGKVIRLGVVGGTITPDFAAAYTQETGRELPVEEGVFILSILEGSPADRMGLQPNDVVIGLNGRKIRTMEDLVALVRQTGYGGELKVVFVRNGREYQGQTRLE